MGNSAAKGRCSSLFRISGLGGFQVNGDLEGEEAEISASSSAFRTFGAFVYITVEARRMDCIGHYNNRINFIHYRLLGLRIFYLFIQALEKRKENN